MEPNTKPTKKTESTLLYSNKQVCRICQSPLFPFLHLGDMPLANGFVAPTDTQNEYSYPLECSVCISCWMVQITRQPPPEKMFHSHYPFFSGSSKHMTHHFKVIADTIYSTYLENVKDPFILEIGSNDGTFLKNFLDKEVRVLGVEPSESVAERARNAGVPTLQSFFNPEIAEKILKEHGPAHAIYAANAFCHIPDLGNIFESLKKILDPKGVIIFEDPYLPAMLEKTSYDQIYDEHVFLFSLHSVKKLAGRYGLQVFDVQPLETHGGSMRYFLSVEGQQPLYDDLWTASKNEANLQISSVQTYENFARACETSRSHLRTLLMDLKQQGKSVAGYAATSKSTTVLNYCGINSELVNFIADSTPEKQGLLAPGSHIPIVSPEYFRENYPNYTVLFGWNHLEEISAKEKDYLRAGGQWIVYVPKVKIL